jgi:hypothetical protein
MVSTRKPGSPGLDVPHSTTAGAPALQALPVVPVLQAGPESPVAPAWSAVLRPARAPDSGYPMAGVLV